MDPGEFRLHGVFEFTEIKIDRLIPDIRSSSTNVSCVAVNSIKGAPGFDQQE